MAVTAPPAAPPVPPVLAEPPSAPQGSSRRSGVGLLLLKILVLGLLLGTAVALTPALIGQGRWVFLVIVWVIIALLLLTYSTERFVPVKYLLPGTLLLTLFIVLPVLQTFSTSTSNFGDGTRQSKEETVERIVATSVVQNPDSPQYNLTVATTGSPATGPFEFFLVDPETEAVSRGTVDGLEEVAEGDVTLTDGFVTEAPGYTLLTPQQINDASAAIGEVAVPTETGAIRQLGIRQAFEGTTVLSYDEASDTITNSETGVTYTPQRQGDREFFVDENGDRLSDQSWRANIGLDNYERIFTDARISSDFLRIFAWTVVFATLSVVSTFLLGLLLAVTFNDPRVWGRPLYRSLLLLPYAIPGFISLLVWASFYNRDFGLLNELTGLRVNWLGDEWLAKGAVLLTNLWLGFPYMFLVCTGALQAIPGDLKEAASIDGASGFTGFRKITFPLLLVTVAPLLVATFAFNFNNFNAIQLLTEGGPFDPANPTAGGTDILITYTIRLAFGAGGAALGFASAISALLFILTGVIAALQFRLTRSLEDVS